MLLELELTIELTMELALELFELEELVATELLVTTPPQTAPVTTGVSADMPFMSP